MYRINSFGLAVAGIMLLCSGCATVAKKASLHVDGVSFHNTTSTPVSNVRLSVREIGGVVSCGPILVGSSCSTTFPVRDYQGNAIIVRWAQDDREWSSESFTLDTPPVVKPDRPATAVIMIGDQGVVSGRLVQ